MRARSGLELYLMPEDVRRNPQVAKLAGLVTEATRSLQLIQREVEARRVELIRLEEKVEMRVANKKQLVLELAVFLYTIFNQDEAEQIVNIEMDELFSEGGNPGQNEDRRRARESIGEMARMVAFIYAQDNLTIVEPNILEEIEERINRHRDIRR